MERYEIKSLIGKGGMGRVYKAYDRVLKRFIALKILNFENPEGVELLKREALINAKLTHPFIVSVYDVGEMNGKPFIAMEFVDGDSLRGILKKRSFSPNEVSDIFSKILEAVAYAHDKGVIHRDIKPTNILFTSTGHPKLVDFGIARIMGQPSIMDGKMVGSPGYMAPEVIEGKEYDERADIYSLGIVLYEMLTGVHPLRYRKRDEFLLPSLVDNSIGRGWDYLFQRATAFNPENRYQSAREFLEDLKMVNEISGKNYRALGFVEIKGREKTVSIFFRKTKRMRKRDG